MRTGRTIGVDIFSCISGVLGWMIDYIEYTPKRCLNCEWTLLIHIVPAAFWALTGRDFYYTKIVHCNK